MFAIVVVFSCVLFLLMLPVLLVYKSSPPLSINQIQTAIQKSGGDEALENEASRAISTYNQNASTLNNTNCPAIAMMASLVEVRILDVMPDDCAGLGVPAHVLIRRGSHFNYQFIYIFSAGTVPKTNNLAIDLISGSIYLRNTAGK